MKANRLEAELAAGDPLDPSIGDGFTVIPFVFEYGNEMTVRFITSLRTPVQSRWQQIPTLFKGIGLALLATALFVLVGVLAWVLSDTIGASQILMLLGQPQLFAEQQMDKQRWVAIMRAAGFDEAQMHSWHQQFEQLEPQQYQHFLESLQLSASEIDAIRRNATKPNSE